MVIDGGWPISESNFEQILVMSGVQAIYSRYEARLNAGEFRAYSDVQDQLTEREMSVLQSAFYLASKVGLPNYLDQALKL